MHAFGSANLIMDDLIFHELWLARNKFNDFENDRHVITDEEEEEDDFRKLFPKDENKKKHHESRSISNNSTSEWMAVIVGVFFVAAIAGIASYQVYKSDFSKELEKTHVSVHMKDEAFQMMDDASIQKAPSGVYDEVMLPKSIVPSSYLLYMSVHLQSKKYNGLVKIFIKCQEETDKIILHSVRTRNTNIEMKDGKTEIKVIKTEYNPHREFMIIHLDRNLTEDAVYALFISFEKNLTFSNTDGFYLTTYKDGSGNSRIMVNTEFEPTTARRAFPCFDEPEMKATFEIFIQHDKSDKFALSNMPVKTKIVLGKTRLETHFEKSPLMSTYLVGFILTNYTSVSETYRKSIKVRVFAPQGRSKETKFAQNMAKVCLKYYEEHFKVNYSLPKLDLVPVTSLPAGADEIWGMIIFDESRLLSDDKIASPYSLSDTSRVICHEISHMWFGNLVTMKWWNDLWLKESFAAYLENLPVQKKFPDWDLKTSNYQNVLASALSFDSSIYTHPIHTDELDPVKMRRNYDQITYEKGASVLSMLINHVGEETFFKGAHNYLTKYRYGNADAEQFWQVMSDVTPGLNVVSFMNSWVNQAGYPVVLIKMNKQKTKLEISQERFVFQNKTVTNQTNEDKTLWHVPVYMKISNEPNVTKVVLNNQSDTVNVNHTKGFWLKGNYGANGYFRTYYDKENWLELLKVLRENHEELSPIDRANILDDVHAFTSYKYMHLINSLEFVTYLSKERHHVPWSIGLNQIYYIRKLFYETNIRNCTNTFIKKLISPVLEYLKGSPKNKSNEKQLEATMMGAALVVNESPIDIELNRKFLQYLTRDGHVGIPGHLLSIVFCAGIKYGQKYEWDLLFKRYKTAKSKKMQSIILDTLACTKDETLLQRYLNFTTDPMKIYAADKFKVYFALCLNIKSREMTWNYVRKNYKKISKEFDPALERFLLSACLLGGKTTDQLFEVNKFIRDENLEESITMKRIVEKIKYHIELVKEESGILKWFKKQNINCE